MRIEITTSNIHIKEIRHTCNPAFCERDTGCLWLAAAPFFLSSLADSDYKRMSSSYIPMHKDIIAHKIDFGWIVRTILLSGEQ